MEDKVHGMQSVVSEGLGITVMSLRDIFHLLLPGVWLHLCTKGVEVCASWPDVVYFLVTGVNLASLDLLFMAAMMRVATMTQNQPTWWCSTDFAYTLLVTILFIIFYFGWFQIFLHFIRVQGHYSYFAVYIFFNLIVSWLVMTGAAQVTSCYRRYILGERPPLLVKTPIAAAEPPPAEAKDQEAVQQLQQEKCNSCGKPSLFTCSGCEHAFYCSVPCQKQDWRTHKPLCKELQRQRKVAAEAGSAKKPTALTKSPPAEAQP